MIATRVYLLLPVPSWAEMGNRLYTNGNTSSLTKAICSYR